MVEWHHQFNGHELEQTLGDSEGWGSMVYCSPGGHRELDPTERLINKQHRLRNMWLDTTYPSLDTLFSKGKLWFPIPPC